VRYVKERKAFGRAIGEFQGIRWNIADMQDDTSGIGQGERLLRGHSIEIAPPAPSPILYDTRGSTGLGENRSLDEDEEGRLARLKAIHLNRKFWSDERCSSRLSRSSCPAWLIKRNLPRHALRRRSALPVRPQCLAGGQSRNRPDPGVGCCGSQQVRTRAG